MSRSSAFEAPNWWVSLNHGGLLIAPSRLVEFLPRECPPLPRPAADRLRRDILRVQQGESDRLAALLDTVLEGVTGLSSGPWSKGNDVPSSWSHRLVTGEVLKPRRVWQVEGGLALPVFVADTTPAGRRPAGEGRLGTGRGRRPVARVVEWLRISGSKVALLTNGRQWRLVHAGPDYSAWCEWDTSLWFDEGVPGPQVTAMRILLGGHALCPSQPGDVPPLLAAIQASRRGQAELSAALGERVRLAVEQLIRESGPVLAKIDSPGPAKVSRRDIYIAATRLVMRCVVALFAEARDLLPRENAVYHQGYGIQGLREQLVRLAGGRAERLRHSHGAWPRLISLFNLIHEGSPHEALPIPRYSGVLFAPGDAGSRHPVRRALAAFEDPRNAPTDAAVHEILELLCVSRVKVRQGRSSTWVPSPVDFSDLSSEYIGILYEGLLDFELHRAPDDDAVVFLRLGDEPALPLSRLEEEMAPRRLAELIGKLGKATSKKADMEESEGTDKEADESDDSSDDPGPDELTDDDEREDEPETGDLDGDDEEAAPDMEEQESEEDIHDLAREVRERAEIWACKAVKEAKLVPYPRDDSSPVVREQWNEKVIKKARSLYRLVLPGQWYLVRWGGTRKGAGTFYTRPQLAVPTVHRTLQPLAYEPAEQVVDDKTGLTTVTRWIPRRPEEILSLKVCDPAMGSGSFLVAALRYLTGALVESLHFHGRFHPRPDGTICKLADGLPLDHPYQETLPVPPEHAEFDERLRARLKRYVVERCIYGVDIDPLAVELARLALWIETMDRRLPFSFLDHKLRCGNSLVGCWFDRFEHYPVMAFERDDAGDKNHRPVHHFREYVAERGKKKGEVRRSGDVWTKRWKEIKKDIIKPEMRTWVEERCQNVLHLQYEREHHLAEGVHDEVLAVFGALHEIPVQDVEAREKLYREEIARNENLLHLREAFDTWCAVWFWPGDRLDCIPTPMTFAHPPEETRAVIKELRDRYRFFHWELEFPDVFTGPGLGFDAVLGNPPWEIQKPNSKEFFSNLDPLYRTYGKREAVDKQAAYFAGDAAIEHDWLAYSAHFKSFSTWNRHAAFPFGDVAGDGGRFSLARSARDNADLHEAWRGCRASVSGYADPDHPFRHQGSADINTYKMFVETGHALLREGGLLGFIVPSGLYTDKGSTDLRRLFLDRCRWEWLFGIENRDGIFDIHRSFKFNPIIVRKGGRTSAIRASFMHRAIEDWQEAERHALAYPRARVEQFSPKSRAILEIRTDRDLEMLEKIYQNSVLLGDKGPDGWGVKYATEFHMTNDSKLFPPLPKWQEKGYRPDEYGHWLKGGWRPVEAFGFDQGGRGRHRRDPQSGHWSILDRPEGLILSRDGREAINLADIEDVALPLYQGVMIWQFDFGAARYVSGAGNRSKWEPSLSWTREIDSQFLMGLDNVREKAPGSLANRVGFRDVQNATNRRTFISTLLPHFPAGNKVPILTTGNPIWDRALLCTVCSFPLDRVLRLKMSQNTINWFYAEELPVPVRLRTIPGLLAAMALRLSACSSLMAFAWLAAVCLSNEFSTGPAQIPDNDRHVHQHGISNASNGSSWCPLRGVSNSLAQLSDDDLSAHRVRKASASVSAWRRLWAVTPYERLRLRCIIDAVIAELYGLDFDDLGWILRDCDHPSAAVCSDDFARALDPKGFWRVDKEKDPELRHTVLTLAAFHDLKRLGMESFLAQNGGEGWMLPETMRLADHGLGHDDRAKEHQPVAERLGPRFHPWQLEQSPEESWEECRLHARQIEALLGRPGICEQSPQKIKKKQETRTDTTEEFEQMNLFKDI